MLRTRNKRAALAMGSVMEIWPVGSYSQYIPKGSAEQRLGQYWKATGEYLSSAVKRYQHEQRSRR